MNVEVDFLIQKMDFGGEIKILLHHLKKKMGMTAIGVGEMDGFMWH